MWVTLPKSRTLGILYAVVQQRGPGGAWFLKWCEKESCYFSAQKKKSDRSEGFCAYRRQRDGSFWRGDTAANWRNLRRHSNNPLRWWWRGQIASSSFGGANHFKWTSKSDRHVSAAGQQIFGLNLVAYTFDQRLHLRLHVKRWGQSSLLPYLNWERVLERHPGGNSNVLGRQERDEWKRNVVFLPMRLC